MSEGDGSSTSERAVRVRDQLHRGVAGPLNTNAMADLDPAFANAIADQTLGDIYADQTLDLKTRTLCTVAALTATGDEVYLSNWIGNALTVGASRDEIIALLRQLFFYVGTPRTVDAYRAAAAAFARHDEAAT